MAALTAVPDLDIVTSLELDTCRGTPIDSILRYITHSMCKNPQVVGGLEKTPDVSEPQSQGTTYREPGGVQALTRGLSLLKCLCDAGGSMRVSEVAAAARLSVPTTHRLLRTLLLSGFVRQLPSRGYSLGPSLIPLGEMANQMLGVWARPILTRIVEATDETANLALLASDEVVYVAQVPSRHSVRMFTEVGKRVLPHCTGVGKAILAQLPEPDVLQILRRTGMPAETPRTKTDPSELLDELREIRRRGYAVDNGEQEVGVRCIAVPVNGRQ